MKKLSELNEGAIGDIIKRASSDAHRIEDSRVDFMSPEEMNEYINNNYSFKYSHDNLFTKDDKGYIKQLYCSEPVLIAMMYIRWNTEGNLDYVAFSGDINKDYSVFKALRDNYGLRCDIKSYVWKIDSNLSNSLIIEIFDIIIERSKAPKISIKNVNEGAIGDIIKRAASDETRIEDNINSLSPNELKEAIEGEFGDNSGIEIKSEDYFSYVIDVHFKKYDEFDIAATFENEKIIRITIQCDEKYDFLDNILKNLDVEDLYDKEEDTFRYPKYQWIIENNPTNLMFVEILRKTLTEIEK